MRSYRWSWPANSDERTRRSAEIERLLQVPPALAAALADRPESSIATHDLADRSLKDCTESIGKPDGIEEASALLLNSAQHGRVGIVCDFDVDGATAQAILVEALRAVSPSSAPDPAVVVPDRNSEGFGPNQRCLDTLTKAGVSCVAVLDCGTVAGDLLDSYHAATGIVPIVVDHHPPHRAKPPTSGTLVNPWVSRGSEPGEQGTLCAAALTWFVALAILRRAGLARSGTVTVRKRITLLAALGTACDLMRLDTPFNRAVVRTGVRLISDPAAVPPGYAALRETFGSKRPPTADEFGWRIGPRLNAGSRMGHSDLAARCLRERAHDAARELAARLDRCNQERKVLGDKAKEELDGPLTVTEFTRGPLSIHLSNSATPGTVGLVASELVKRFGWPAFAFAKREDGLLVGSGRSALKFDVGAAVDAAREQGILHSGGGHAGACGLKLAPDRLHALAGFLHERFKDHAARFPERLEPSHCIDVDLDQESLAEASMLAVADAQCRLEPWGHGLERPLFGIRKCTVAYKRVMKDGHLGLTLESQGSRFRAVWWHPPASGEHNGVSALLAETAPGKPESNAGACMLDVVGRIELNEWNERREGRFEILDARPVEDSDH